MKLLPIKFGIVVIGRNEGERLKRCLRSIRDKTERIVYVDSGSTDGSTEFARSLGVDVVELDMSRPFTMARGRNAGFKRMLDVRADTELVQFVDGDCELVDGYLEAAARTMLEGPDISVVTGRRVERYPNASIYNQLCNIEWGRDIGEIQSCGGDMMVRSETFESAGMFNPTMIAGEEPELCVRLRKAGGKIVRIDHDMTLHDAAIYKFSQWWKRSVRGGHACAEGAAMHGRSPERHKVRNVRSALLWGAAVPIIACGCAAAAIWWSWALAGSLIMLGGYVALVVKITRYMLSKGYDASDATLYAVACVMGKFPTLLGIIQYRLNRVLGRQSRLIEYKHASTNMARE
jgi:GT2 family glycosyltransferase